MVQAYALATVNVCRKPGVRSPEGRLIEKAKIETIPAGSVFDISQEEFDELEKSGAVRKPSKVDRAKAESGEEPEPAAAAEAPAAATQRRR